MLTLIFFLCLAFFSTDQDFSSNTPNNCSGSSVSSKGLGIGISQNGGTSSYLKHLHGATPVIIVAWNNASSNGGKSWADTQLFCISADHVAPGSESGVALTKQMGSTWYLAVLSVAIILLTFTL